LEIRKELSDLAALDSAIFDFEGSKRAMVILRSSGAQLLGRRGVSIPAFIKDMGSGFELVKLVFQAELSESALAWPIQACTADDTTNGERRAATDIDKGVVAKNPRVV